MGIAPRGSIYNKEAYKQLLDFSGFQFERKITPTDIDYFVDLNGEEFIFGEFKTGFSPLPYGQKLALQRLADGMSRIGPTLLFVGEHNTPRDQEINGYACVVREYYSSGKWWVAPRGLTVLGLVSYWRKQVLVDF